MKALLLAHRHGIATPRPVPLCLLPAFDRPLLAHMIEDLWDHGARELVVTVDERTPLVEGWFQRDRRFPVKVRFLPGTQHDTLSDVLFRLPAFEPKIIAEAACFGRDSDNPRQNRTHVHSLEDYRRAMLRRLRFGPWHPTRPGIPLANGSLVQNRSDRSLAERHARCYVGSGVVVSGASRARDSILLEGSALLGRSDVSGCVILPGTVVRDCHARDTVVGFERWAERLVNSPRSPRNGGLLRRVGWRGALRYQLMGPSGLERRASDLVDHWITGDCDPALRQSIIDWAMAHPQEALSQLLSFR